MRKNDIVLAIAAVGAIWSASANAVVSTRLFTFDTNAGLSGGFVFDYDFDTLTPVVDLHAAAIQFESSDGFYYDENLVTLSRQAGYPPGFLTIGFLDADTSSGLLLGSDGDFRISLLLNDIVNSTFEYVSPTGLVSGNANVVYLPNAIPETGTWAMLLMGFAAIGATLRRKVRRARELLPA